MNNIFQRNDPANDLMDRPYPNEHSCRLKEPDLFKKEGWGRETRDHKGREYSVIFGVLKSTGKSEEQAYRYNKDTWTANDARKHCTDHNGISFEPATEKKRGDDELNTRSYQLRFETIDEKTRSIEAVIATENPVQVMDYKTWTIISEILLMTGCRISQSKQIPMLDSHQRISTKTCFGSTRELRIDGIQLKGRNYFADDPDSLRAWGLVKDRHITDNSIGYKVYGGVIITRGMTEEVNGKKYTAPPDMDLRVTTDWEPKENSICIVGADADAKMRKANFNNQYKRSIQMDEFKKWLQERGLDYETLKEEQRTALKADLDAQHQRTDNSDDKDKKKTPAAAQTVIDKPADGTRQEPPLQTFEDGMKLERKRTLEIRQLAGDDVPAEVVQKCIDDGLSVEQSGQRFLAEVRKVRPKVSSPGISTGDDTINRELIVDGLLMRAGYGDIVEKDKNNGAVRAEKASKIRDLSLLDVCRHALFIDGISVPVGRSEMIRAAFSTSSLPIILGAVANKSLLKGYNIADETWRPWCSIGSAPDFKTMTRARLTDMGQLEEVGSGGEVKHGYAAEENEQYNISTYAKLFSITRQQLINDDIGALTKQPQGMGVSAKRKIADLVYAHLMANGNMKDGIALFYSTHGNLNTTHTFAAATLKTALAAFWKQTDKNGNPINVPVAFVIVPPDLKLFAMELVKSPQIINADTAIRGNMNVLADLQMSVVSDSRLCNANYTNNSTSTWYLAGDPNVVDTIEVAFLNGKQEPTIEQFATDPNLMGITFRVFHDVGCKSLDYRGLAKCTT